MNESVYEMVEKNCKILGIPFTSTDLANLATALAEPKKFLNFRLQSSVVEFQIMWL